MNGTLLHPIITRLLNDYIPAKQRPPFAGHPLGVYLRNDAPESIYQTGLVDRQAYLIMGSVGQGIVNDITNVVLHKKGCIAQQKLHCIINTAFILR